MKNIFTYLFLTVLCFQYLEAGAQKNHNNFLSEFNKADYAGKAALLAKEEPETILTLSVQIKDTLAALKNAVYTKERYKKLKFIFDKIDAGIQAHHKNYARSIFILENSLRHNVVDVDDSIRCLIELKKMFIKIRNYNKAIELCYGIENKWSRKTDTLLTNYDTGKSGVYFLLGLTDKAVVERKKEFFSMYSFKDTMATISYLNDVGVYYNKLKNSDSAEFYFVKARHLLDKIVVHDMDEESMNFYKSLIEGNLGLTFYNDGRIKEAMPLLSKDVYYSLKSNNYESALNSYLMLSKCALGLNNLKLAGQYLDSAKTLEASKINDIEPKLKITLAFAEYYNLTGNLKLSNQNYREYFIKSNEAREIEYAVAKTNENISLSVDQKEKEILEKDILQQKTDLENAKQLSYQAYLFAGIFILLVIVGLLINNNYSAKKREAQLSVKNVQISAQNQVIEQALKDKEVLIKEIHHRVKNNLQIITSMLSLQIGKVDDEKTESILRDARQRISSIALTHEMLYQKENLSHINPAEYIERLARQVELLMPATQIELVTEIVSTGSRLSIDNAVPLGLVVNELLTNAYKHAFPNQSKGRILVVLTEDEKIFTLTVSDNGIGMPQDFGSREIKTLGMELVHILAEQLDSKLTILNNNGSIFTLIIKKNN